MGLFDKLFKGGKEKEEKRPEKRKTNFKEIDSFLEEETKSKKPELEEKIEESRKKFIEHFKKLDKEFDELYHANFEQLILEDKRDVSKIVETNRRNYCNGSKKSISNALWYLENKKSALDMRDFISEIFNKMNSFSREAQILSTPFKKQIKNISSNLKKLKEEIDEYESFLNSDYQIIQKEEKAKELRDKIVKNKSEKRKSHLDKLDSEKEMEKVEENKNKIESEISNLKSSEKAKTLEKLKREKNQLERQENKIVSEINGLVLGISRQIKMYIHKHEIGKTDKTKLDQFLEHPATLLQGESYIFETILKNTKKDLDKLEKDKKKRKKFLETAKEIEKVLENRKKRYNEILDQISKKSNDIEKLTKEIDIEDKKNELKKVKENIRQLEKDKKELEKSEKKDEENEEELLKKLEQLLSEVSGKEIKIKNG